MPARAASRGGSIDHLVVFGRSAVIETYMSRLIKICIGIVGLLLLAVVLLTAAVVLLFDPEDYRDLIADVVHEQTGRTLEIEGGLSIDALPCCSIALDGGRLSNPPGFAETDFAHVESVKIGLRLWPLIVRQEIMIGDVRLDGLELTLTRRADGVANWEFESAAPAAEEEPTESGDAMELPELSIAGLNVRNAHITLQDAESGLDYRLEELDFRTGSISVGQPFDMEMSFQATDVSTGTKLKAALSAGTQIDLDTMQVALEDLKADLSGGGGDIPADELSVSLQSDSVSYDVNAGSAALKNVRMELAASGGDLPADELKLSMQSGAVSYDVNAGKATLADLQADIEGRGGDLPADEFSVSMQTDSVSYDIDAGKANLTNLQADVKASGGDLPGDEVSGTMRTDTLEYNLDSGRAAITNLVAGLNGAGAELNVTGGGVYSENSTNLTGTLEIEPLSPRDLLSALDQEPVVTADPTVLSNLQGKTGWSVKKNVLALDGIDVQLDDTHIEGRVQMNYVDFSGLQFQVALDEIGLDRYLAPTEESVGADADETSPDSELPIETLRDLDLDGRIRVGRLTMDDLALQNLDATIKASDGLIRLDPSSADLYGGRYQGALSLDVTGDQPKATFNQSVASIRIDDLLAATSEVENIEGLLQANIKGSAAGQTSDQMIETLAGDLSLDLADGVYKGVDIWHEIRKARALLRRKPAPEMTGPAETPITKLSLNGRMDDGRVTTRDMTAEIPFIRLTGDGVLDLVEQSMDYRFKASVFEEPKFADGEDLAELKNVTIPLTLKGSMDGPTVGVDLAKLATNAATKNLQDRLLKKLGLEEPATPPDGAAPDGAATDTEKADGTTTDAVKTEPEPEKSDKDAARDALKKGLRDLFKP
jgi:uncharacterized protein involved in outer membrane biogenesis